MRRVLLSLAILAGFAVLPWAQRKPEAPYRPSAAERRQLQSASAELAASIAKLRAKGVSPDLLAEVEIHHKAAEWILRYQEEFYRRQYVQYALDALAIGAERARLLAAGSHPWTAQTGRLVRAYRSRVDGSTQPYALVIPDSYDGSKPVRLDVVLHGRNGRLNEAWFIATHESDDAVPALRNFIQLEVFGRTNNAYRWSGETDVHEAIAAVRAAYNIDPDRVVLRGFSMGGAGAWHLGLHYPDRWAAIEAGAGFTETIRYAKLPNLPAHQRDALHIYDAADYALNAVNLAVVGYGGEDDAQLQAAVNIREALRGEGFRFDPDGLNWKTADLRALFLVGPKTGHKFHPASKAASNRFIDEAVGRGRRAPDHIRFVTYTTRYPKCFWVTIDGLKKHYRRAEVDAVRKLSGGLAAKVTAKTKNVRRLILSDLLEDAEVSLDGQIIGAPAELLGSPVALVFEKTAGRWRALGPPDEVPETGLRKKPGLQGPIDDAFRDAFLAVRPTGQPLNEAPHDEALAIADLFAKEYPKWLRADVPARQDSQVTPADIDSRHLVLFGDPGSNSVLAQIASRLPIRWNRESITVGERHYSADQHLLVMIYPNPLNPERYVVINSGHTFHEAEFRGTNAYLFPRLGDFAILRLPETGGEPETVQAGFFDEDWKLPAQ